ncbi:alpha/beta fold hydrolase [Dictyobacter arantiisoli]|uniref:Alpha/beta hydrolase n=1 Tax=Dictyobacter arantiisoli TaxID=2014874 RepID=A0A5A5TBE4_9CHLR|nr:alpha/beta hydrolase [Dictyobacter arantiisoli]GCF08718.1 alpha/beta hydrolase [Dictyobacter arantiisoli]
MTDQLIAQTASHMIDLPAGRFHYLSWGAEQKDRPAFVLLHGITSSAHSWVRLGPALANRFRVFALDMRGHGESIQPAPGTYSLHDTANDAAAFIQALDLQDPYLLGHSWGGATAIMLASEVTNDYPSLHFTRIILEDPAHNMGTGDPVKRASYFTGDIGKPDDQLRAEVRIKNPAWSEADIESKIYANRHVNREAVISVFKDTDREGELLPLLSKLSAPTLLVRADPALESTFTDSAWEEAKKLLPGHSTAIQIPGASHNIHRNKFDEFLQAINAFLQA